MGIGLHRVIQASFEFITLFFSFLNSEMIDMCNHFLTPKFLERKNGELAFHISSAISGKCCDDTQSSALSLLLLKTVDIS